MLSWLNLCIPQGIGVGFQKQDLRLAEPEGSCLLKPVSLSFCLEKSTFTQLAEEQGDYCDRKSVLLF